MAVNADNIQRLMLPIYSALHLIPTIVLRRHHVRRDPLRMLAKVIWGITRSCSFLGVFVVIYQGKAQFYLLFGAVAD